MSFFCFYNCLYTLLHIGNKLSTSSWLDFSAIFHEVWLLIHVLKNIFAYLSMTKDVQWDSGQGIEEATSFLSFQTNPLKLWICGMVHCLVGRLLHLVYFCWKFSIMKVDNIGLTCLCKYWNSFYPHMWMTFLSWKMTYSPKPWCTNLQILQLGKYIGHQMLPQLFDELKQLQGFQKSDKNLNFMDNFLFN